MAWVSKKRGNYGVGWRDSQGDEHWHPCANVTEARALRAEIEACQLRGRDWDLERPVQGTALTEILRRFIEVQFADLQPRTVERDAKSLDLLLRFVAPLHGQGVTAEVLSRALLEDFATWLGKPENGRHGHARKRVTVMKTVQCVERAWRWAEESDRWPDIPRPRTLKFRRPPPPRRSAATFEEWDQMLGVLQHMRSRRVDDDVAPDWFYRAALVARYTGARRLALLQLRWEDIDLDELSVDVRDETTKGGYSGRTIPLHPALAQVMRRWKRTGSTLIAAPEAEISGRGHVDRCLRRAWKRAGVREQAWFGQPMHVARRTLRTHLVTQGVQADVIDAFTGHAGQGTGGRVYTDRDARWLWAPLVAAVATIPAHRARPGEESS